MGTSGAAVAGALMASGLSVTPFIIGHDSDAAASQIQELESIESELLSSKELESLGIHIFDSDNTQLSLKRGALNQFDIFKDLKEEKIKGLNIVLFDDSMDLKSAIFPGISDAAMGAVDPIRRPQEYWDWSLNQEEGRVARLNSEVDKYETAQNQLIRPKDFLMLNEA